MRRISWVAGAAMVALMCGVLQAADQTLVTIYKNPWCGCCESWAIALKESGYAVELRDLDDLSGIKQSLGVPDELQACHTAKIGDYFVEGHVPLEAISQMMSKRPDIAGLAVPGMPKGSLGMGVDPNAQYDVYAVPKMEGGAPSVFYRVAPQ